MERKILLTVVKRDSERCLIDANLIARSRFRVMLLTRRFYVVVRVTADIYSHGIRGRDDEAARRWEEFQRQTVQERPEKRWKA